MAHSDDVRWNRAAVLLAAFAVLIVWIRTFDEPWRTRWTFVLVGATVTVLASLTWVVREAATRTVGVGRKARDAYNAEPTPPWRAVIWADPVVVRGHTMGYVMKFDLRLRADLPVGDSFDGVGLTVVHEDGQVFEVVAKRIKRSKARTVTTQYPSGFGQHLPRHMPVGVVTARWTNRAGEPIAEASCYTPGESKVRAVPTGRRPSRIHRYLGTWKRPS